MVRPQENQVTHSGESRDRLLAAARKVFAKRGYDGATVKELSEEAGLNISLVSYYFGGKEGLYKACIEEAGKDRLAAAEKILKTPESPEDFRVRLTLFLEEFFEFHLREKDLCAILNRECSSDMLLTRDVFRETFLKAAEKLRTFFASAQKSKILKSKIDPDILNYLFFGAIRSAVQFEPISKEFFNKTLENQSFRDAVIRHAVDYMVGGFMNQND